MRLVFDDLESLKEWIKDNVEQDRYEVYTTENEIVFVPVKSTRPIKYAYMRLLSKDLEGIDKNGERAV